VGFPENPIFTGEQQKNHRAGKKESLHAFSLFFWIQ
jgi:hypothetical protein